MIRTTPRHARSMRYLLFLMMTIILGGCAGQVNMRPTLSQTTTLTGSEGLVVARIVNASAYPLPFNQLTITPEDLNESSKIKPERLQSINYPTDNTTLFASPVKAGTYALSSIRAFHTRGDFWYSRFAGSDAKFGTFTVKPGEITDLGTLVYYPKPQEDKYFDTLLRLSLDEPGEVLRKYFSYYAFEAEQVNGWDEDDFESERQDLYVSVAQNPVSFRERYQAPDGSLYFLAKLGVIIERTAEGEWLLDAVDTNLELTSIAKSDDGELAVGGIEGRLFYKQAGDEWQDVSLAYGYHIEKLVFHDGHLDVLAKTETQLEVFRADLTGPALQWLAMEKYNTRDGWQSKPPVVQEKNPEKKKKRTKRIVSADLTKVDGQDYVSVTTQPLSYNTAFRSGDRETFMVDLSAWQVSGAEEEPEISTVLNAGAVKLGIKQAGFWSWDGRPTYLRHVPSSNTWEEIKTSVRTCKGEITTATTCDGQRASSDSFTLRTIPWFKSELEGVAIVTFRDYDFWSGKSDFSTKILLTEDGGKSWQDTGNELPKSFCSTIVPEVSDALLISCDGATGDFYQSTDNGATWEHVRQHENF